MEKKCKWCGNIDNEMQFQIGDDLFCSENCYKEMKFGLSIFGTFFQQFLMYVFVLFFFIWFVFLTIPLTFPLMFDIKMNGGNTAYLISASLFLPSLLFTINIKTEDFLYPSRYSRMKILTEKAIPYWIVFFYYLYVIINLIIIIIWRPSLFDISFSEEYFSYNIANILLFLSCISIMILLRNKYYLNK